MAIINSLRVQGKVPIDFHHHESDELAAQSANVLQNPDGSITLHTIGGYSKLENAALQTLSSLCQHVDYGILGEDRAVELGRFAVAAAKSVLESCRPLERARVGTIVADGGCFEHKKRS